MPGKAVARTAVNLPWLCPNSDSLIGLAEKPESIQRLAANDTALLVLLLRSYPVDSSSDSFSFSSTRFKLPTLLDCASIWLAGESPSWLDPSIECVQQLQSFSNLASGLAAALAGRIGKVAPLAASVGARICLLGWLAVAAVEPQYVAESLSSSDKPGLQKRHTVHFDGIARRLAVRWKLPSWAAAIPGNLHLPFRVARDIAPDRDLFAVVQMAVWLAERRSRSLDLTLEHPDTELHAHLGMTAATLEGLVPLEVESTQVFEYPPCPYRLPLIGNLLKAAAAARRRDNGHLIEDLENRIDRLHDRLVELGTSDGGWVQAAKLDSLAELAAGAGHEINNPLAVISGNAQRLMRTEPDPERNESLRTIVRQTHRIAGILRDLMQFARPSSPMPKRVAIAETITRVVEDLTPLASSLGVKLSLSCPQNGLELFVDPNQVRDILTAVLRNGIEAASREGWARLSCELINDQLRFIIEDSGPGMTEEAIEHAFDPFFCGRSAGRGRGLGLSTAWQLARKNGGSVRFEPNAEAITRFVISFPRALVESESPRRISA